MLFIKKQMAVAISALCSVVISGAVLAAETAKSESVATASKTNATKSKKPKIEEVTITGSYTAKEMNGATGINMSLRETPQTVTIMTSQMIEDKGLVDMEQVLDHVPGVSKVGDASEFSIIYVRGFELDTGVQIDGMITTAANSTYSATTSQGLDPVIAERVEILKGAAGILGGQGEPSATVNMIRKRPTTDFQASVNASAGSWNTYRTEGDISGSLNEEGSIRGRFVAAYMDNESFIDRYSREKAVVYGIVEGDVGDNTTLTLAVDNVESHFNGVYNWSSNPAFYTDGTLIDHDVSYSTGQDWAYRDVKEWSVMPEIKHEFNNGWELKASYRLSKAIIDVSNATLGSFVDKATGNFVDPWSLPNALHSDRKSDTDSFNLAVNGDFDLFSRNHDFVFGYSYSKNEFTIESANAYLSPYNLADTHVSAPDYANAYRRGLTLDVGEQSGVFTTVRFSLAEPLKVMIGGRLSDWSFDNTNFVGKTTIHSEEQNVFTPYAGIVYDVNSFLSVYTSYTGIFKPVGDYGADGQVLDPTEGTNTEAGIKMAFFDNDLNISAAVYEANKDNVSAYANVGQLPNGNWIYESIDGVKTKGYEIEIAGSLTPNWSISGGFTHNTAKDEEGNIRTSHIPNDIFKITNSYSFEDKLQGLTLGASARWQGYTWYDSRIAASVSTTGAPLPIKQTQPAYWLADIFARYELTDSLSVSMNVDNLFDKSYNRSIWSYADFGDPRSVSASVKYKF